MVNQGLFQSASSRHTPTTTQNEAGGRAYSLPPKHALAQMAATGTFNNVYYTSGQQQLEQVKQLIVQVDDNTFLAKLAVYARERAFMKDMPAALVAALSARDPALMHQVFHRVIDNGRMLRTLFQMIRSGQFGKKSLSSSLQRAFQAWLNNAPTPKLLSASIGSNPSLRDILRLARPTPKDNERRALFGFLTGRPDGHWAPATIADLPQEVRTLMQFQAASTDDLQAQMMGGLQTVRWDLLAGHAKGPLTWKSIARQMGPQALRMNLNTLQRHGVLDDYELVQYVAREIADPEKVRRSRQFPYQFMAAYINANEEIPYRIKQSLHQAAEVACGNIPELPGPVLVGLDTSGSMSSPVTGRSGRGTPSKMRCVDVAALFAAAILRRNPDSVIIPFDTQAYRISMDPGDTILSLANRLRQYGGGGTDCSLPLQVGNQHFGHKRFAGCILVSDNESWVDHGDRWGYYGRGGTSTLEEWNSFQRRQKGMGSDPKFICINIQPYQSSQAPERPEILNIGGFSDAVFNVVAAFLKGDSSRFVTEVEAVQL